MYSVPTYAQNALDGTSKNITHYGVIETVNGTIISFSAGNIVGGSAVLNKKVSSRNSIDIGTVYASQLKIRLILPGVSRYTLFGAKIWLYANIINTEEPASTWASIANLKWSDISSRTWASFGLDCEIPLGAFTIASAEQGIGSIQITAYDDMLKFDSAYAPDATARTPYNWLTLFCSGCGIALGSTQTQIQQLANGSRSMAFKPNTPGVAIKSYRDCLAYLCEALCCVAYIDRSGRLRLAKYGATVAKTIGAGRRYTSSLSDFVCYYTGLYATNAATAIAEYYSNTDYTGEDDGLVLELGVNPLLQIENDTQRRAACQAIIDSLSALHYVPYSVSLPAHPEFDVLDVLKFSGNQAGANDFGAITDITYTVNGATKINCAGENPKLLDVVSRADKTISSLVDIAKNLDDSIIEVTSDYQQAIEDATKAITGNVGGYVVIRNNQTGTPTNPDEILILDAASQGQISAATNVWRWNASGFGFSHTGYNGNYTTAIYWDSDTGAPKIAADYITVGYLSSERVKIGTETLTTTMNGVQTDITDLQVDLSGFHTTVSQTYETKADATTKLSTVRSEINQTAESITLSVTNGDTTAGISISITDQSGRTTTKSGTINMTGLVTFTALSTAGSTTINGANIQTGTITATQIATGTITATQIAGSTITGAKIASGTIEAGNIKTGTITATQIAASTITGAKIASGTIEAGNIKTGTITATQIATGTITATQIAASTITGAKIASDTIEAGNIKSGTITATQIAASTITGAKIASGTIEAGNIKAKTITASQIADATITNAKIVDSTITGAKIAANTITAANIQTDALVVRKIFSGTDTTHPIIDASNATTVYVGGYSTSSYSDTYTATNLNLVARSYIKVGKYASSSYSCVVYDCANLTLRPGDDSSTGWKLGGTSYRWADLYTRKAHIGAKSSGYLIDADGSLSTLKLGTSTTDYIGFFGATPNARQTLSTTSTNMGYSSATSSNYLTILNNIVGILKTKYGLIG